MIWMAQQYAYMGTWEMAIIRAPPATFIYPPHGHASEKLTCRRMLSGAGDIATVCAIAGVGQGEAEAKQVNESVQDGRETGEPDFLVLAR